MLPRIQGIDHITDYDLNEYVFGAPEADWLGRLDTRAWGKSKNLFLYFTNVESGEKFRLSVFARSNYHPYEDGPSFRKEPLGKIYKIKTAMSKNGFPKFLKAEYID